MANERSRGGLRANATQLRSQQGPHGRGFFGTAIARRFSLATRGAAPEAVFATGDNSMRKRLALLFGVAAALAMELATAPTSAQTLRIAMTVSDLPIAGGIPDQGAEGSRFAGYPAYDALVNWDFTHPDQIAGITPGLATEWHIDPANNLRWIMTLRQGVKFQDGTDFNADAVVFNYGRSFDDKAPYYDAPEAPFNKAFLPMYDHTEKIDDDHVAIFTKYPFSLFPYLLTRMLIVSPTQYEKVGKDWTKFNLSPIGTGPFKVTKIAPHVSLELTRNENYWDKTRIPKLKTIVLYPMAEATTRLAALRSGQVDWIEVPPPDSIASLKAAGFKVSIWRYPHSWPWFLYQADGSPLHDVRVRRGLNYGVDRDGLVKLVNGTAKPASGMYEPGDPLYGSPHEHYTYDLAKAQELLKEAGYGPDHHLKLKVMISQAGSGQMVPVPMNEYLQQNLKKINVDLDFDVVDWGSMIVAVRNPALASMSHGDNAMNISWSHSDPTALYRFFSSASIPPNGFNWSAIRDPDVDKLLAAAFSTFDEAERDSLLAQAHTAVVDNAHWLFIVHDLNPRAMSPKVKGFVPAQSWFQDFTHVTVEK
jgi:peptide/nickel transport system substrate-binding protein